MKEAVAKAWAADLRENVDKQGTGLLHTVSADGSECFCVMGRLCKLAADAGVTTARRSDNHYTVSYGGSMWLPSSDVLEWAGLKSQVGYTDESGDQSLMGMNDNGRSFHHLADVIEQNWESI